MLIVYTSPSIYFFFVTLPLTLNLLQNPLILSQKCTFNFCSVLFLVVKSETDYFMLQELNEVSKY